MLYTFLILHLLVCLSKCAITGDSFTVDCVPLTTQRSDPIVYPGVPSPHVHAVIGGNAFRRNMTGISAANSTATTCDKLSDHSNYFVPQLYYYSKGYYSALPFLGAAIWYQRRACDYAPNKTACPIAQNLFPKAFPNGFRMVAGNTSRQTQNETDFAQVAIGLKCISGSLTIQHPGFPTRPCDRIITQVYFPSCWDGNRIDSPNHQSHVAYPVKSQQAGVCPKSHPIALLSIYLEFTFNSSVAGTDFSHFAFSNGDPYGYGLHAGFIMGWTDPVALQNAYTDCTSSSNCPTLGTVNAGTPQVLITPAPNENVTGPFTTLPGNNSINWDMLGVCGDARCDPRIGESCSTCFFDCGACASSCTGNPPCGGPERGNCTNGVCECKSSFAGPDCSFNDTLPIVILPKGNNGVAITPTNNASIPKVTFNIVVTKIEEIDPFNYSVALIDITQLKFNSFQETITLDDNSTSTQISYNSSLANYAFIKLSHVTFQNATTYDFAGERIHVPDNSVKYSFFVQNWPFESFRNHLRVTIQTYGVSSSNETDHYNVTDLNADTSQNLLWIKKNVDGISLYTTFMEYIIKDGQKTRASFEVASDDTILLSIPSFMQQAEIDPTYCVLADPRPPNTGNCGTACPRGRVNGNIYKIIGGTVGAVFGIALFVVIAFFVHRKKQNDELEKAFAKTSRSST